MATIALSTDVALAQGLLALALLIALQFVITWSSVRWAWVRRTITGEPSLLLFRGEYLQDALRRARVTEEEVRAAVRSRGMSAIEEVEAVVLETDGSFSVVESGHGHPPSSLAGIEMPQQNSRRHGRTAADGHSLDRPLSAHPKGDRPSGEKCV